MKMPKNPNDDVAYDESKLSTIVLAGGCFWGTQAFIRRIYGVARTLCGYANGCTLQPTYDDVCSGTTGYVEAVAVKYDHSKISLHDLLSKFFRTIDPTSKNMQGNDIGTQYRTGIYYTDEKDRKVIEHTIMQLQGRYDRPIVTEIMPLFCFFDAEDYHQDYLEDNPNGYCHVDLSMLEEDE